MNQLTDRLAQIEAEAAANVAKISSDEDLKLVRAAFLGKKGALTEMFKLMGELPPDQRPQAGAKINILKEKLLGLLDAAEAKLTASQVKTALSERFDITLPGRVSFLPASVHPVTQIMYRIEEIFTALGFSIFEGPEIETDWYNFEALNVPKDHPARDMQDTFYISAMSKDGVERLLRTHTSPAQIHAMENGAPPIRIIVPGAVYRKDADITHSPMFHQVEGLLVGENITMGDLKGVLTAFLHEMFGKDVAVRFRPSFFPFTEPSAEVDIQCVICGGATKLATGEPCRVCKQTGFMEIMGCGMVDPNVFKAVGYDPKKYSGFAFGMGVERIAMLKYGISDIRLFFENDLRFLRQF